MPRKLPAARVVGGLEEHPSAPVRWFLRSAGRTMKRPAVHEALAFAIGMWPLWILALSGLGLVWFIAMSSAP
jgi:hypothetical protein